jgi:hypothetical protein
MEIGMNLKWIVGAGLVLVAVAIYEVGQNENKANIQKSEAEVVRPEACVCKTNEEDTDYMIQMPLNSIPKVTHCKCGNLDCAILSNTRGQEQSGISCVKSGGFFR